MSILDPKPPTRAELTATYVPKWKASTAYSAGDKVLSPNGDVVSSKADHTSGASFTAGNWDLPTSLTAKANAADVVPKWKANTAYLAGDPVVSPSGDVVTAKVNFTSGANYSAANWNLSTSYPVKASVPVAPSAGHLGVYDRRINVYNQKSSNTRLLTAAFAAARVGSSFTKVVMCGDSTTRGIGVGNPLTQSAYALLRARLTNLGYTLAGTGLVWAFPGTGGQDSRWAFSAGWGPFTEPIQQCNAANATATFTSDAPGTAVTIITLDSNPAATWSYSIDGAAAVTVTPGSTQQIRVTEISGLSNANHTVVIKALTGTATYLVGVEVHGTAGLSLSNLGIGGATAATWSTTNWYSIRKILEAYQPKASILQLETNDARTGVQTPVATYAANMATIVSYLKGLGDVVLMAGYPVQTVDLTPYTSALYDLADANDLALIDPQDRWGSWATANANNLMPDALHPGTMGYGDAERMLAAFLAV